LSVSERYLVALQLLKKSSALDFLHQHVESLIFCSSEPISVEDIISCLSEMFGVDFLEADILSKIEVLKDKYATNQYAFEISATGGGFQFLTKPAYQASIGILLKQKSKKRLSTSALETLAIIAYKQPVTKTDIEHIRGVSSDYSVHKLLEKQLIEIRGKAEAIGRPILYGTSTKFMEYFGINALSELPMPKDFSKTQNTIGEETEI
jgi:segregation and condensation protein B